MNETERVEAWGNLADAAHWLAAGRKVQMRRRGDKEWLTGVFGKEEPSALVLEYEYRLAPEPEVLWCNKFVNGLRSFHLTEDSARKDAGTPQCRYPEVAYEYVAKRFVESP